MNHGDHETTTTSWDVVRRVDEGDYMEMRITSTVEGCPYDFSQVIKMTRKQMAECPDPNFTLGQLKTQAEMEAHALQWEHIFVIKQLVMSQPVHDWGLEEWIVAAPFLFSDTQGKPLDEQLLNDEDMQKERDTWR